MSFSTSHQRRLRALFLALAAAALALIATATSASAAPATGEVTLTLKKGAQSSLLREGVKVTKAGGKSQTVKLTVTDLSFGAKTNLTTSGTISFRADGKSATLNALEVSIGAKATTLSARVGKQRTIFFRARGIPTSFGDSVAFKGPLSLTGTGAKALRAKLELPGISAGQVGSAAANGLIDAVPVPTPTPATPTPPLPKPDLDPYFAQCSVSATSEAEGDAPAPAPLPTLVDSKATVGPAALGWGLKESFRGYVTSTAGGSIHVLDGASTTGVAPAFSGFGFPLAGGEYAINDLADMSDDQAIVKGSGTAVLCGTKHKFRVVLSNPTLVIDGADSRIVVDLDTNLSGVWTPTQRVDFAELDLDGITPFYNRSGSEVSWEDIPAALTEAGAEAFGGFYPEGEALDPVSLTLNTPYDLGAKDAAAWTALASYVETELPFPLADPTQGGCEVGVPAGGSAAAARTIDEALGYDPAGTTTWHGNATRPDPVPDLSGKTALTGGKFDWGFRSSLRGSINSTGEFNLLGTTASNTPYYGHGPGATPPPAVPGVGQMSGAGKYFRWPQAADSFYDQAGAGSADDRLVLRTSGRVAFCQTQSAQRYATVLSNPTVIVDGANSRITIDVATRYRLSWVRGVVDFATLDLTGITPSVVDSAGTTTVTWTFPDPTGSPAAGPVKLTKDGERVVRMLSGTAYVEGLSIDGTAIAASFPTPAP
ncbi:MAG: hypothetical protein QOE75_1383 [Solirubrobacterales bacterium]|jgi:hypothetical protein|nr:hypothetical protein [Solirubrobacterales bacterium]